MTPTLRQLEYLVALARTLNFREAAEACHVSQPALSAQIQQLEQLLGVQLFERDKRSVRITPAGEALTIRARVVLAGVDDLVGAARAFLEPLVGTLRLGVIPTVAPYLLPAALPAIRAEYPGLRLLLREDQTEHLLERLSSGDLDLLLLALEADLGEVHTEALFSDPFVLATPIDHGLARADGPVAVDALGDEGILLLEDGHCLRDQALSVCDGAGARELVEFRASSLNTLVQMVAAGEGITLLPSLAVRLETREGRGLATRAFDAPCPARTIGLAWRPGSPRADEFRLLGAHLRAAAEA